VTSWDWIIKRAIGRGGPQYGWRKDLWGDLADEKLSEASDVEKDDVGWVSGRLQTSQGGEPEDGGNNVRSVEKKGGGEMFIAAEGVRSKPSTEGTHPGGSQPHPFLRHQNHPGREPPCHEKACWGLKADAVRRRRAGR